MLKTFPEWDLFFTDFLRVPTVGKISEKHILEHFGPKIYQNEINLTEDERYMSR